MKVTEAEGYGNRRRSSRMFSVRNCQQKAPSCESMQEGARSHRSNRQKRLERVARTKQEVERGGIEARVGGGAEIRSVHAATIALPGYFRIQR